MTFKDKSCAKCYRAITKADRQQYIVWIERLGGYPDEDSPKICTSCTIQMVTRFDPHEPEEAIEGVDYKK